MSAFSVSPAASSELLGALQLLLDNPERGNEVLTAGVQDLARVYVARDWAGRLCGAALGQLLPGALGVVGPLRGESAAVEQALAAATLGWLRDRSVKVCQAFAPPIADMASLESVGFRPVTQLVILRRTLDVGLDHPHPDDRLEPGVDHPGFVAALLATHEGTLDCPELSGTRTPEELVAGFDRSDGAVWQCLTNPAGTIIGVVLTEPANDVLQITYLGVIPTARGQGVGDRLLRRLLADAANDGFAAVELCVDVRNEPALRLYRRQGFTEVDRREVWLAHISGDRPA